MGSKFKWWLCTSKNTINKGRDKMLRRISILIFSLVATLSFVALISADTINPISNYPPAVNPSGSSKILLDTGPNVGGAGASGYTTLNLSYFQQALTNPVTGPISPTAGFLTKWGISGNTLVDGVKLGSIFSDSNWCTYTTASGLQCNQTAPGGSMTWPSGSGLAVYSGSSTWNASIPVGTMTNSNWCRFTTVGGFACDQAAPQTAIAGLSNTGLNKWTFTAPATSTVLTAGADNCTYTFPSSSKTLMASDFSNAGTAPTWNQDTTGLTAAHVPAIAQSSGTTHTLATPSEIYECTNTCTVTAPVPPPSGSTYQFCVQNDNNISTVVTIAMPAGVMIENSTRSSYGTAGIGHGIASSGAIKDEICFHSKDATHYNIDGVAGTWTNY
jgi:hypothetical protein